jgi:hypothetical protein
VSFINPEDYCFTFIIEQFKHKRNSEDFFYSQTVTTKEGLQLRLKIYPRGTLETDEQGTADTKLVNKPSKNEDYLSMFI